MFSDQTFFKRLGGFVCIINIHQTLSLYGQCNRRYKLERGLYHSTAHRNITGSYFEFYIKCKIKTVAQIKPSDCLLEWLYRKLLQVFDPPLFIFNAYLKISLSCEKKDKADQIYFPHYFLKLIAN